MVFGYVHGTDRSYLMHASTFAVRTSRFSTRALIFAVPHDKIPDNIHSLTCDHLVAASSVLVLNCTRRIIRSVWVFIAIHPNATLYLFLNSAYVSKVTPIQYEPNPGTIAQNESDTNADTCCFGSNFMPLNYSNRSADVHPYSDEYSPIRNIPIISGATAYDHPNGNTYILIFNECLYFRKRMKHSLINPNQIRWNGLQFQDNPTNDTFIEMEEDLTIPLNYVGTKCVFDSRAPTKQELIMKNYTNAARWKLAKYLTTKTPVYILLSRYKK